MSHNKLLRAAHKKPAMADLAKYCAVKPIRLADVPPASEEAFPLLLV